MTPQELMSLHTGLAKRIAGRWKRRMNNHPLLPFEGLEAAAFLGLAQAANRYDPTRAVPFEGYAFPRVSGAVIDYIRQTLKVPKPPWERKIPPVLGPTPAPSGIKPMKEVVREHFLETYEACGKNKTVTAKALGVCIKTIYIWVERYKVD